MTIKELIERLKRIHDPTARVYLYIDTGGGGGVGAPASHVSKDEIGRVVIRP